MGKFYVDSLVHDKDALNYLINVVGHEKICLGSDYPFPLGEKYPGELIQNSAFTKEIKEYLFYKSAISWLNLNEENYF